MTEEARLQISPDLSLPLDAVTETFAILAKRGTGKSNAAVVMAEEMYDNGLQWVAIDPKGDWWGVRSSGDGEAPGLAVLVFGGQHGDIPLEPGAGLLVADLIVDRRLTCVLDVSEMTKADQRRFLVAFADRLYRRNTEPLHVFCEEADEYIPQRVMGENAKLVGAFETLVKRGRTHGLGITLITQRSASLNKDVLTQIETLFVLRTPSPQDRKAILAWVDVHAAGADAVDALPGLDNGEAFVFSPQWLDILCRVRFRRRRTFDSGATPRVGERVRRPANLAEVDLGAIREAMAEIIEHAEAEDPAALRRHIRVLEHQLAQHPSVEELEQLQRANAVLCGALSGLRGRLASTSAELAELAEKIAQQPGVTLSPPDTPAEPKPRLPDSWTIEPLAPPERREWRGPGAAPLQRVSAASNGSDNGASPSYPQNTPGLAKAERAILAAILNKPDSSPAVVGFLAGYSPKSSSFQNALGRLRTLGLIDRGRPLRALDGAREALGHLEPLPSGEELRRFWLGRLGRAERTILEVLLDSWPTRLTREELSARSGYSHTSSSFQNAIGRLRTLELCVRGDLRPTEELMQALGERV